MTDQKGTETRDSMTTREIAEGFDTTATPEDELTEGAASSLLPDKETERFTGRWQEIQASFVDEPRSSVERADALVADLMQKLAAGFSDERQRLEGQWDRGDDVSTEELRVALTRYRSFFDRLLAA
jgi:hypothetical protein